QHSLLPLGVDCRTGEPSCHFPRNNRQLCFAMCPRPTQGFQGRAATELHPNRFTCLTDTSPRVTLPPRQPLTPASTRKQRLELPQRTLVISLTALLTGESHERR